MFQESQSEAILLCKATVVGFHNDSVSNLDPQIREEWIGCQLFLLMFKSFPAHERDANLPWSEIS